MALYFLWATCYTMIMLLSRNKKVKRIGIDARFYGPIGKGLGRYTQEIVDGLVKLDQENEYVIFLNNDNFAEFNTDNQKVKKVLASVRWYSWQEQLLMPWLIIREKIDLMHFPHFNVPILCPTKFIVTIHDLILFRYPTNRATTLGPLVYKIKNIGYKFVIWFAVRFSQKIITVSEFTKNDIVDLFKINGQKIIVSYEGVSNSFEKEDASKEDDKQILLGYNIHRPYMLYVGNVYPHKNLEGLFKVFTNIIKKYSDLQLILVGKEDYFYIRLKKTAEGLSLLDKKNGKAPVVFTEYVSDNYLKILYKEALFYIFPSFYEGFGLPPLEAMSNGLPVVSSNRASLPEILGDAAMYFDPEDSEDMYQKIEKIILNENLRMELTQKGYKKAKQYSWNNCVRETLKVYNQF